MEWDLLIKGGTVVDPGRKLHTVSDIAVSDTRIDQIGPDLDASRAETVIDASGRIVTPGFIDIHTHNFVTGGSVDVALSPAASSWPRLTVFPFPTCWTI